MSEFDGKTIENQYGFFNERIPSSDVETVLIEMQRETDEIGLRVARLLAFDLVANSTNTADAKRLLEAAGQAADILAEHPPKYDDKEGFMARYLYDHPGKAHTLPPLLYPPDHFKYAEFIEGSIGTVSPVLVEHPTRHREGPLGYRLCAEVELGSRFNWIPIGEIYIDGVSFDQGMAECIKPDVKPLWEFYE